MQALKTDPADQVSGDIRANCRGVLPLDGRLEEWMLDLVTNADLSALLARFGSPLNIVATEPFVRNVSQIEAVAERLGIDFRLFFARKANKCLAFVDHAAKHTIGVDTASQNELDQCVEAGIRGGDLICTAAVKDEQLLMRCAEHEVCIAVDNLEELCVAREVASKSGRRVRLALRLGGFMHRGSKLGTRFGFDVDSDPSELLASCDGNMEIVGVHFHLSGYDAEERVSALRRSIEWVAMLRAEGCPVEFIDMGGGFPMSYLQSEKQWQEFWHEHRRAMLGKRPPLTYGSHGLGLVRHEDCLLGEPNVYPFYQSPSAADWLAGILSAPAELGNDAADCIADSLRSENIRLHCEPGRAILDGCGVTIAKVEFTKQRNDGSLFVGLAMNKTQCRTSTDDFLVDPLLIPAGSHSRPAAEGYLVGAYCMESELLSLRRLVFPAGIKRGDIVMFPNTAGYYMHFLESRSHQFPLAANVVRHSSTDFEQDRIDSR